MQPEPSAIFPAIDLAESQQPHSLNSQHGYHDHPDSATGPAASDAAAAADTVVSHPVERAASDATTEPSLPALIGRRTSPQRRLKSPDSPSPPAYNRIIEYENALSPSPKRKQGPGFEVIRKPGNPGDKRSLILELPNGW
jgi:hypothetical protein